MFALSEANQERYKECDRVLLWFTFGQNLVFMDIVCIVDNENRLVQT